MGLIGHNRDPSSFFRGKRVFVTGHTGFTGAWMVSWLLEAGAHVTGYALATEADQPLNLFDNARLGERMTSIIGDIRDRETLFSAMKDARPELVFHLAAQPIVRLSYREPAMTYDTNVMGTLNVLEAARAAGVGALVNITSDKAYQNEEWIWGYRENDRLGGHDIYSSSKACADILTRSFWLSFCQPEDGMRIVTGRAGNIIGGGDWATDRLVADIARAYADDETVHIRRPDAVRPWQHVLEPVRGYMQMAAALAEGDFNGDAVNLGPHPESIVTVGELAKSMMEAFESSKIELAEVAHGAHEANLLRLDITRARVELGWSPVLAFDQMVDKTAQFYRSMIEDPTRTADLIAADLGHYRARLNEDGGGE